MVKFIEINASKGEGGGQILRTSLSLSALLQKPVKIKNIRAKRPNPGLARQHLTSIKVLKAITHADIKGLFSGSKTIYFKPKKIHDLNLNVNIGSAGSISLLIQQLLPVSVKTNLLIRVIGGTHVAFSPSITFTQQVLLPSLRQMNLKAKIELLSLGFFPKGNGRVLFKSKKSGFPLKPINLSSKGKLKLIKCFSYSSGLPSSVSVNQSIAAKKFLEENLNKDFKFIEKLKAQPERKETIGSSIDLIAVFTNCFFASNALGKKGVKAETIGLNAARKLIQQLNSNSACDLHLADQLIPFMALAKGKSKIHVSKLTQHTITNISITEKFLPVKFKVKGELNKEAIIQVKGVGFK